MADSTDRSHSEQTFLTDVGVRATVQRTTVGAEAASLPNKHLADLGLACHPSPTTDLKYMGSAAVHVYWHDDLKQVFFVSQTQPLDLYRCPQPLASKAFDDLLGTMKAMYGQRRGRLRSGF